MSMARIHGDDVFEAIRLKAGRKDLASSIGVMQELHAAVTYIGNILLSSDIAINEQAITAIEDARIWGKVNLADQHFSCRPRQVETVSGWPASLILTRSPREVSAASAVVGKRFSVAAMVGGSFKIESRFNDRDYRWAHNHLRYWGGADPDTADRLLLSQDEVKHQLTAEIQANFPATDAFKHNDGLRTSTANDLRAFSNGILAMCERTIKQ